MILSSAVVKVRKRFIMCRKSYITGERIRHRQQTIRQVRCMRLKPENVQFEGNLERCHLKAEVSHTKDLGFYRVKYEVEGTPLISIIIPNKDERESLKKCIDSIEKKSTYENYEILIVENNSTSKEIFEYYKELK